MAPDDWQAVSEIYQQGLDTNLASFQTASPDYETWNRAHLPICRIVAKAQGKVIGWAALSPVSSRPVYAGVAEVSIYIALDCHHRGVGTLLLKTLCEQSERQGIWTLQSVIMQENAASIRLHEKCGFRTVGYRERIGKDRNGLWRNTVLMEKRSDKIE